MEKNSKKPNERVSIITPCYNAEATLERYLKSILDQTYPELEVIAVDDGSTDQTAEILKKYCFLFEKQNRTLKYIFQENAGLGAAINTGLKYVTGAYLCWADPDDFYMPGSMEKRVEILKKHPEYAVVSSDAYVYAADHPEKPLKKEAERFTHRYEEKQFEYLLLEESHFCAGCHMIRMSDFETVNPKREIYPARRGQNWQLLLPVYYSFRRYFLDEPLYAYLLYPHSMSAGDVSESQELKRWEEHEEIIYQTLNKITMKEEERKHYEEEVALHYAGKRFFTAIDYKDKKKIRQEYQILCGRVDNPQEMRAFYRRNRYLAWKLFYRIKDLARR